MEELVRKAKNRDPDAFTELMMGEMQTMYKTARAILENEDDAADAISDTILACWEKLAQLKEPNYFRTWMVRILINKCKDIISKKREVLFAEEMPDIETVEKGFADSEWQQALEMLEEHYRAVIVLYYVEGFTTPEIAKLLEIPEATVRTRLARARERIAKIYEIDRTRRSS